MWWALLACRQPEPTPDAPIDFLTADRLEEATTRITDLGPRSSGTPGEEAGHLEMEAMFRESGLDEVTLEPFVWDPWLSGPTTVEVGGEIYAAEALSPSPPTVGLELSLSEGLGVGEASLYWSSDGSRAEQFVDAAFGGAGGMIRVTEDLDFDGGMLVEVGHTLEGSTLPAVAVDSETGHAIAEHFGETVRLNIGSQVVAGHTSYNVLAKVEGKTNLPVFVVAHYDSWHPSESAFDNALGAAALTLLAGQVAQGSEPAYDVYFLATTGEEQGLQGAQAWANQNDDLARSGRLVITLDVLWSGEGHFVVMASDDDLRASAMAAAEAEGLVEAVEGDALSLGSDHVPFFARGVPAIWCGRWSDRHYHTVADTTEYLDFELAGAALRSQWRLLADALELSE